MKKFLIVAIAFFAAANAYAQVEDVTVDCPTDLTGTYSCVRQDGNYELTVNQSVAEAYGHKYNVYNFTGGLFPKEMRNGFDASFFGMLTPEPSGGRLSYSGYCEKYRSFDIPTAIFEYVVTDDNDKAELYPNVRGTVSFWKDRNESLKIRNERSDYIKTTSIMSVDTCTKK
jgi:hypothetical protein